MRSLLPAFALWLAGAWVSLRWGIAGDLVSPEIVAQIRLPRLVQGTAVGAGLSVAGVILQALFSNPLCEPYTLGISSGAALGAVLGGALGWSLSWSGLAGSAFLGAFVFSILLYLLSLRFKNQSQGLLLSGVMLGFLGSSLVALLMAVSDSAGVQGALYWLLGDLTRSRVEGSWVSLALIVFLSAAAWWQRHSLDAFLLGEEGALSVGVDVVRARKRLLLLSCLMVAICVSGAGMVGFIGLMVPHAVRRFSGALHVRLVPGSFLWGAGTMIWADVFARNLAPPFELPVGVITALVGAPFFIVVVSRRRGAVS